MIPTNFYEQNTNKSNGRIEKIYKTKKGEASPFLTSLSHNQVSDFGYLDLKSSRYSEFNSGYDTLSLVFSENELNDENNVSGLGIKKDYDTTYNLTLNYIEKPLESADKYLAQWNYDVYKAHKASLNIEDFSGSTPADWNTAKLVSDISFPYRLSKSQPSQSKYKQASDAKEVLYTWILVATRTKKGQEVFPIEQPVIQEKIYFSKEKKAIQNLKKANTILTPKETFGYSGEWLCQPSGIQKEGKYFVTQNKFTFANSWDKDLYE